MRSYDPRTEIDMDILIDNFADEFHETVNIHLERESTKTITKEQLSEVPNYYDYMVEFMSGLDYDGELSYNKVPRMINDIVEYMEETGVFKNE
jgi:transcription antitermination factor NusA-like protein